MTRTQTADARLTEDWQLYGACRDLFQLFYEDGGRPAPQQNRTAQARALCEKCPVQKFCAAYALRNKEQYGIWGGLTESDRTRLYVTGWEDLADDEQETVDMPALRARLREIRRRRYTSQLEDR